MSTSARKGETQQPRPIKVKELIPDPGAIAAAELRVVRHVYAKADEVYRIYRALVLQENKDQGPRPSAEWIPLSWQ